jgi:hypothetical protein
MKNRLNLKLHDDNILMQLFISWMTKIGGWIMSKKVGNCMKSNVSTMTSCFIAAGLLLGTADGAVCDSEMLVSLYWTVWRCIPEDATLCDPTHRHLTLA